MPYDRHCNILTCIKTTLDTAILANASGYMLQDNNLPLKSFETRIEDFDRTAKPEAGIIISPEKEFERPGLNSTDDILYSSLITRTVHALGSDDKQKRLAFRAMVRLLFHNKKILCAPGCLVVSTVDFGDVKSRRDWEKDNDSVSTIRVNMLCREPRE